MPDSNSGAARPLAAKPVPKNDPLETVYYVGGIPAIILVVNQKTFEVKVGDSIEVTASERALLNPDDWTSVAPEPAGATGSEEE